MLRRLVWVSVAILFAQAVSSARDNAAPHTAIATNKSIEGFHIEAFGIDDALRKVAQTANVVIGVEALRERDEKIAFDFPGGTVADLLDMFVARSPNYRWEEDNRGIIHVSRKGAHLSLTDVVVSYPGARNKTRLQMWMDIQDRPEVKVWMESANCRPGGDGFRARNFKPHRGPISIAVGPITVGSIIG
jgi:hypothetical protein